MACWARAPQPSPFTERKNLTGDAEGKRCGRRQPRGQKYRYAERGGLLHNNDETGQCPWSEGGSHRRWIGSTDDWATDSSGRNPIFKRKAAAFARSYEPYKSRGRVRTCEGLAVKFPLPTRQLRNRLSAPSRRNLQRHTFEVITFRDGCASVPTGASLGSFLAARSWSFHRRDSFIPGRHFEEACSDQQPGRGCAGATAHHDMQIYFLRNDRLISDSGSIRSIG